MAYMRFGGMFRHLLGRKGLTASEIGHVRNAYGRRCCSDCSHVVEYVNLWCSNADAINARYSNIPDVCGCPYWSPDKRRIRSRMSERYELINLF